MTPGADAIGVLALAAILLAIGALNFLSRKLRRNGDWHSTGSEMCRFVNRRWESRPFTPEEQAGADEEKAWWSIK